MTTPTAPRDFHLGIAVDAQCKDWKPMSEALNHAVSRRVADGETIIVHDITPWASTHIALLWAIGSGHAVDYCPRQLRNAEENDLITRLDTLYRYQKLDGLIAIHYGPVTSHRYHTSTNEVALCLHHATTQLYRPTRQIAYTVMDKEPALYPYHSTQNGNQLRPYGNHFKIGHFYAPKATEQAAAAWLWNCIEPFTGQQWEYRLNSLKQDREGWWHYNMERDFND